jgi:cell division protein FtsB
MKYLTFLDYPTLEATGRSFEAQIKQKDKEIDDLRQREKASAERIAKLESQLGEQIIRKDEIEQLRQHVKDYETRFSKEMQIQVRKLERDFSVVHGYLKRREIVNKERKNE